MPDNTTVYTFLVTRVSRYGKFYRTPEQFTGHGNIPPLPLLPRGQGQKISLLPSTSETALQVFGRAAAGAPSGPRGEALMPSFADCFELFFHRKAV